MERRSRLGRRLLVVSCGWRALEAAFDQLEVLGVIPCDLVLPLMGSRASSGGRRFSSSPAADSCSCVDLGGQRSFVFAVPKPFSSSGSGGGGSEHGVR